MPNEEIVIRELQPTDWPLVKNLFGTKGACGGCWCMHWRRPTGGKAWEAAKGEPNRRAFKKLVESGQAHGVLAIDGAEAVGWCAFGLRSDFLRLERTRAYQRADTNGVWSINCLFLGQGYRGLGLSGQMVSTAVEAIHIYGGEVIEAYPVTLTQAGKKLPAAFSFTGPEIIFKRAGFKEVQRLAISRPLYRLSFL